MSCELFLSREGPRTWAALRENGRLATLRVEDDRDPARAGHIFKARVTRVVPGIQSAFVDIGLERDAYLPAAEVVLPGDGFPANASPEPIQQRVRGGDALVVQVEREGSTAKGPRVTCRFTLPGRYLVLLPTSDYRGVSRRIDDAAERRRLQGAVDALDLGEAGAIVRSAAEGVTVDALAAEAARLAGVRHEIGKRSLSAEPPTVVHEESELAVRMLREGAAARPDRIVVDDAGTLERLRGVLRPWDPELAEHTTLHPGPGSVLADHGLEPEIRRAFRRKVWLKSGGYLQIEPTEALVSIDVNTGRHVRGATLRDTVLTTNLEAAREIARQLRLRDLGGIIVIDFVDMGSRDDRDRVLSELRNALVADRARTKVEGFSSLGLVQLARRRRRRGPLDTVTRPCAACRGRGRVRFGPPEC